MPALEPTTESRLALVERFFSGTAGSYDFVVHASTLGADRRWKRRIVASIPPHAQRILDLASGTGILTFAIAESFPRASIVGVELREEYLAVSRRRAHERGLGNVEFVLGRAEEYWADRPFDAIVSSYLAKYADLAALTKNARSMLNPGGLLLMHDFTYPSTPFAERLWRLQFGVIRPTLGTLFPSWRSAFDGLPTLIEQTRWVPDLMDALQREDFSAIKVEELSAHGSTMVLAHA